MGRIVHGTGRVDLAFSRVLVIDDDPHVCRFMELLLEAEGFAVRTSLSGADAVAQVDQFRPDVILLDLGLPDRSGFEVCDDVRRHFATPILIVSGHDTENDIVTALGAGADGYLIKPIRPMELVARVRAHARRVDVDLRETRFGPIVVDREHRRATVAGRTLKLTSREYEILAVLVADGGNRVTRRSVLVRPDEHRLTLDGHIRGLRNALESIEGWRRLVAVRGVGFRLRVSPDDTGGDEGAIAPQSVAGDPS